MRKGRRSAARRGKQSPAPPPRSPFRHAYLVKEVNDGAVHECDDPMDNVAGIGCAAPWRCRSRKRENYQNNHGQKRSAHESLLFDRRLRPQRLKGNAGAGEARARLTAAAREYPHANREGVRQRSASYVSVTRERLVVEITRE